MAQLSFAKFKKFWNESLKGKDDMTAEERYKALGGKIKQKGEK